MLLIRKETEKDYNAIKEVNNQAFSQAIEGNIIDKIRISDPKALSLVATLEDKVVGHIFFSSAWIHEKPEIKNGMGLAPMAVLPKFQKQGIGCSLINEGIRILKQQSVPFIIVLGLANYYPKFGFETASKHGLKSQWEGVPDEAFMVLILDADLMNKITGTAFYREEFNEAV